MFRAQLLKLDGPISQFPSSNGQILSKSPIFMAMAAMSWHVNWRLGVAGERSSQRHPGPSGAVATAVHLHQAGTGLGHHHLGYSTGGPEICRMKLDEILEKIHYRKNTGEIVNWEICLPESQDSSDFKFWGKNTKKKKTAQASRVGWMMGPEINN